jgi:hypothetical protein
MRLLEAIDTLVSATDDIEAILEELKANTHQSAAYLELGELAAGATAGLAAVLRNRHTAQGDKEVRFS